VLPLQLQPSNRKLRGEISFRPSREGATFTKGSEREGGRKLQRSETFPNSWLGEAVRGQRTKETKKIRKSFDRKGRSHASNYVLKVSQKGGRKKKIGASIRISDILGWLHGRMVERT